MIKTITFDTDKEYDEAELESIGNTAAAILEEITDRVIRITRAKL